MNYQVIEMEFRDSNGSKVVLRGMSNGVPQTISAKQMELVCNHGDCMTEYLITNQEPESSSQQYFGSKKNLDASAPSKIPATCSLRNISRDWKAHLLVEYSKNIFYCDLKDGLVLDDRYRIEDEVIFYKDRIYLTPNYTLKWEILNTVHDPQLARHQGLFETYRHIRQRIP